MNHGSARQPASGKNQTTVERKSDRELVVRRTFDSPPQVVFDAWTTPELFKRWWAPKSMGVPLLSCEMDVRAGGGYRLAFGDSASEPMAFFGRYVEVAPASRLVWTNEESGDAPVTTVTFEQDGDRTRLVLSELYPSKEPVDDAIVGMEAMMSEQFAQLDQLLATPDGAPARGVRRGVGMASLGVQQGRPRPGSQTRAAMPPSTCRGRSRACSHAVSGGGTRAG